MTHWRDQGKTAGLSLKKTSRGSQNCIENRLSLYVEFYARELLKRAEAEIGHFYFAADKGKKPIAYYWARVGTCSNSEKLYHLTTQRTAKNNVKMRLPHQ